MRDLQSWDELRLVLALAREGSLLGAGRALGVNASTVGRRLEALEEHLGVQIFDRTRQGVLLTALAEQLLPFAEAAEQAAADFVRIVEGFEQEVAGLVRITAPPGIASFLLAGWVQEWLTSFPQLRIQIDAEVGYVDLSRRESDIALRSHRPQSGDLIAVKLLEGRSCIMASPALAAELGEVDEITRLPWIVWGPTLAHMGDMDWLREQEVPASQMLLHSDSMDVQARACAKGLGVMLIHEGVGRAINLVPLSLSPKLQTSLPPTPHGAIWLVSHRALRHVPRIAAIWEALLHKARSFDD